MMNPFSKSVCILPAACGAFVFFCSTQTETRRARIVCLHPYNKNTNTHIERQRERVGLNCARLHKRKINLRCRLLDRG